MISLTTKAPCTHLPPTEHSVGMPYKDGVLTKVGPAVELMVYNQHHCWILFNSLCLTMAASLSTSSKLTPSLLPPTTLTPAVLHYQVLGVSMWFRPAAFCWGA